MTMKAPTRTAENSELKRQAIAMAGQFPSIEALALLRE
jgi:hypothetical protein